MMDYADMTNMGRLIEEDPKAINYKLSKLRLTSRIGLVGGNLYHHIWGRFESQQVPCSPQGIRPPLSEMSSKSWWHQRSLWPIPHWRFNSILCEHPLWALSILCEHPLWAMLPMIPRTVPSNQSCLSNFCAFLSRLFVRCLSILLSWRSMTFYIWFSAHSAPAFSDFLSMALVLS